MLYNPVLLFTIKQECFRFAWFAMTVGGVGVKWYLLCVIYIIDLIPHSIWEGLLSIVVGYFSFGYVSIFCYLDKGKWVC